MRRAICEKRELVNVSVFPLQLPYHFLNCTVIIWAAITDLSGCMGMWHITQKVILLLRLFLNVITRSGGGQGGRPQRSWAGQVNASCWEF